MSDDPVERAATFLDGLGLTGAQKRGAALALVDLMRSVVREEKREPGGGNLRDEIDSLIVTAVEEAAENYQAIDWTPITVLIAKLRARLAADA